LTVAPFLGRPIVRVSSPTEDIIFVPSGSWVDSIALSFRAPEKRRTPACGRGVLQIGAGRGPDPDESNMRVPEVTVGHDDR
jgi:hypothetical protein